MFGTDIEARPACGGAVQINAFIEDRVVIEKILTYLDTKAAEPETSWLPPCRAPLQRGPVDWPI